MGVYNNNKDGTRSTLANTIQVVDAPMEQFVSRGEFNAVVPSDTSADNKLVNDDKFDTNLNDIWKVQGKLGAKNFIKYPYYNGVSKTENGITFTENDGAITINGTPTGNAQYFFAPTNISVLSYLPKGKYIMSVDDAIPSNIFVQFLVSNLALAQLTKDTATEQSFEITSDTTGNIQLKIIIVGDKTFDNVVIRPMIRLASDTDATYQPYAPTNYQLNQKVDTIAGVYLPNASTPTSKKVVASVGQTSVTFDANSFMTRYNVTASDLDLDISAETSSGDVVAYNNVSVTGGIVTVTFDALAEQTTFICKCSVIQ